MVLDIESERTMFERWYKRTFNILENSELIRDEGTYDSLPIHLSWQAWLARAELV